MFDSKVLKTELTCHTGGASQSEYRWEGEEVVTSVMKGGGI